MSLVLFLCTGNYYRSRFAEELFNHLAEQAQPGWTARSRALALERGINNIGPLSPFAMQALAARGIGIRGKERLPRQCMLTDLETADRVVALDEDEHRPLMVERFPSWEPRIEYWQVRDIEFLAPDVALAGIERQVKALLSRLA
jgi:protein-tyrosine phosphatase